MDTRRRILIVDDEPAVRDLLVRALADRGLDCRAEENAFKALARLEREPHDVVVTDIRMPGIDGIEFLKRIKTRYPHTEVIIITGVSELQSGVEAMRAGAYDYVTKPFAVEEVVFAVERALHTRDIEAQNRHYQQGLEEEMARRTFELLESKQNVQQLFVSMLKTLANTLEAKDLYTRGHSDRVAAHAVQVGERLELPARELSQIELAGLLHDIGKIGVREAVLHKPDKLTDEEYEHIKGHTVLGERILKPIEEFAPVLDHVRHHHERFDGRGYPDGLCGDDLSLGARILAVCDTYDAMTSERPYRSPYPHDHACQEIRRCRGSQFDPTVADAFLEVVVPTQAQPTPTP